MKKKNLVSIIYVYFNTPKEINDSISSISHAILNNEFEIIIVDNDSKLDLPVNLLSHKKIRVIKNQRNKGYGAGCNIGAKNAKGDFFLFINPDTKFRKGAMDKMVTALTRDSSIGVIGPKMIDDRGNMLPTINSFITIPRAIVVYTFLDKIIGNSFISKEFWQKNLDRSHQQQVEVLSGACIMIPRKVFEKVKGFDTRFFMYFEEQDLCFRIKRTGYRILFFPDSVIKHSVGASLKDKAKIKEYFQKSRYLYLKKYFGKERAIIVEAFIRLATVYNLLALAIVGFSAFINTYLQSSLMLLIGDAARDFIAAKNMIIGQGIPLVGIPSSVPWLHQGPLSIYAIAFALSIVRFNPIAPGIFFGLLGAVTTLLIYILGKSYFNEKVGILSAIFYATTPLTIVNARMPYHTSLIPLFSCIFFLVFEKSLKKNKLIPVLFFCYGLLLLVELSNVTVIAVPLIVFFLRRTKLSLLEALKTLAFFLVGISPFILYDLVHGPTYSKFPLWIANRMVNFMGSFANNSSSQSLENVTKSFYQQIVGLIIPNFPIFSLGIFVAILIFLGQKYLKDRSQVRSLIVLLWILIPLLSFFFHKAPGTAYFTLIYPAFAIGSGVLVYRFLKISRLVFIVFFLIVTINITQVFSNNFYVTTEKGPHPMPPTQYNFGSSWKLSDSIAAAIVADAKGRDFNIIGSGNLTSYPTSIDPYVYLAWYHGGKVVKTSPLEYTIYQQKRLIPKNAKEVFTGIGGYVTKYE